MSPIIVVMETSFMFPPAFRTTSYNALSMAFRTPESAALDPVASSSTAY